MKLAYFLVMFIFFLPVLILAQLVKVGIKMNLKGEMSAFFYNTSNGILEVNLEFFNSGSVAYKARARLSIINSTDILFDGWSDEKTLMPGERKVFEIYYYTPETFEDLTARIRVYYGKELVEHKFKLRIENEQTPEGIFEIKNFRTYDDYLRFEIKTNKSVENVLIIPEKYMMGWIFKQEKIESLHPNKNTEIILPYKTEVWIPHEIVLGIVTKDGKYYSSYSFKLEKERGLWKFIHYITDKLSVLLNL
jgi:hypothetical protein